MREETGNPFAERLEKLRKLVRRRRLDLVLVQGEANVRSLTGVACDNACFTMDRLYTDFRYVPMVHRTAPWLPVGDIRRLSGREKARGGVRPRRIGYEGDIPHSRFAALARDFRGAAFVDIGRDLLALRAVKTPDECERLRAAAALNDEIWLEAQGKFRAGMTEREMARVIRHLMVERGDGEAFETIVCAGRNAAECHHVPDDTVWDGREPVLVDMGVKLAGYCSDMTRNIVPARCSLAYRKAYDLVLEANRAAIAAAKPGMTGKALDRVARRIIAEGGFGKCFGHSLGHGVGLEIHEAPNASARSDWTLEPGMAVTIEPGVYLEGNLGVRIEDLVLITENGCEVLTHSPKGR